MSELRKRQPATASEGRRGADPTAKRESHRHTADEDYYRISLLDVIRLIASMALLSCALSYYITNSESYLWGYRPWFTRWPVVKAYLVS